MGCQYLVSILPECYFVSLTVEEKSTSLIVRCNALEEGEGIADSVGRGGRQLRRVKK